MANGLYALSKKKLLDGEIDLLDHDLKCVIIDATDYTVNLATDEFLDDIAAGARVATSGNLASKATTGGVFTAADVTFTAVSGHAADAVVIYRDTGTAGTSPLIAYITDATGLPVTPGGGDIIITWDTGANGIFAL